MPDFSNLLFVYLQGCIKVPWQSLDREGLWWPLWAELSTAPCQIRAISSCPKKNLPLPELSYERCWLCSWESRLRNGKTAAQQELRKGSEKCERKPCSQGQCRRRAGGAPGAEKAAPCKPRDAHGGAGCASADHRHHMELISTCSHGGAYGAAVDFSACFCKGKCEFLYSVLSPRKKYKRLEGWKIFKYVKLAEEGTPYRIAILKIISHFWSTKVWYI